MDSQQKRERDRKQRQRRQEKETRRKERAQQKLTGGADPVDPASIDLDVNLDETRVKPEEAPPSA